MKLNFIKNKIKQTNLEKYGVENVFQSEKIKDKIKETNIKEYGVEYSSQNKEIKEKTKQTNLKKYGYKYPTQNEEIKKKLEQTNLKKYGYKYPPQNKEIKEKTKQTNIKEYGVENVSQNEKIKESIKQTYLKKNLFKIKNLLKYLDLELLSEYISNRELIKLKCLKCDTEFETQYFYIQQGYGKCPNCFPKYRSIGETELLEFVKSIEQSEIIKNSRDIISPYELDIYIPDKNIAIEFNGLYWHSEEQGKDKYYHLNKTELCESKNIQLIHIFEDEWIFKQNNVKNLLYKIIIENYDFIDENQNIIDRRFSKNRKYYENKGYIIIVEEPNIYNSYYKIWDCGYYKLKKLQ